MQFKKYRKAISVFFAALLLVTVCVVLPMTVGAGYIDGAQAEKAAVSDMIPGDQGMAGNNARNAREGDSGAGGTNDGDILDPNDGTVDNDVDHNGGDTSDGMDDSRDTSGTGDTSENNSDTSDKNTGDTTKAGDNKDTSDKDTTKNLADDVKDETSKAGVWGIIIAIIIIVIIIALIFAFVPKRKK